MANLLNYQDGMTYLAWARCFLAATVPLEPHVREMLAWAQCPVNQACLKPPGHPGRCAPGLDGGGGLAPHLVH